jgi:hypothetical protein
MFRERTLAQAPPSTPKKPASHWHSALPGEDSELAGHVSHVAFPTALLNVPGSHALHAAPSETTVYPATHTQSATASLPSTELVCEGHAVQFPAPVAALYPPASHAVHAAPCDGPLYPAKHVQFVNSSLPDAELVPAGHGEHSPAPTALLNVPASHALHATPSEAAVYPAKHLQ